MSGWIAHLNLTSVVVGVVLSSDSGLGTFFSNIKIVSPKLSSCRSCINLLLSTMSRKSVNGYLTTSNTLYYYQNLQKKCTELENVVCLPKHWRAKEQSNFGTTDTNAYNFSRD